MVTTEAEFYAARKHENDILRARRFAPTWTGTSRRKAKGDKSGSFGPGSVVVDMNYRTIRSNAKR